MTPVLLVDQNGNTATKLMTPEEIAEWIDCAKGFCHQPALPTDEGLDPETCYRLNVEVEV